MVTDADIAYTEQHGDPKEELPVPSPSTDPGSYTPRLQAGTGGVSVESIG